MQDGKVKIKYIGTVDNLADIFTKPVGKEVLQHAQQGLGLTSQQGAVVQQTSASPLRETVEGDVTMVKDVSVSHRGAWGPRSTTGLMVGD